MRHTEAISNYIRIDIDIKLSSQSMPTQFRRSSS